MTTTWKIHNIERQLQDGLVIKVVYGCTAEQAGFVDRNIANIELTGNPEAEDFVPYADLTEELVIGWVQATLGETATAEFQQQVEDRVTGRIAELTARTTEMGLPWSN